MIESTFAWISRAETLWHEGQTTEARAALCSLAQDMTAKWWARLESLHVLARLVLKDDAVCSTQAMLAELPAEGKQNIQLEIPAEGKQNIQLEIAELLAAEEKNTARFMFASDTIRWNAAQLLSQFPGQRELVEQVWEELARNGTYEKVRICAVDKLRERGRADVLVEIGGNQSTVPLVRKRVAAALRELGQAREAEAILRDMDSTKIKMDWTSPGLVDTAG